MAVSGFEKLSSFSQTVVDENGAEVGRILYDSFGGVITNSLPVTLTAPFANLPDAATGLAHVGNGRWYDPATGRPLQPNPVGGPPALPQALNRYAAAALIGDGRWKLRQQLQSRPFGKLRAGSAPIETQTAKAVLANAAAILTARRYCRPAGGGKQEIRRNANN